MTNTTAVKILASLKADGKPFVGPLKAHASFTDLVNHAVYTYIQMLREGQK